MMSTSTIRMTMINGNFMDEEDVPNRGNINYQVKPVADQLKQLHELFPDLGCADDKLAKQSLPNGAEGSFAIPRWQAIASTYSEAVQVVLTLLAKDRNGKFDNYCADLLDPDNLRQTPITAGMWSRLEQEQKDYDILIVPAQFGQRFRDTPVIRVRELLWSEPEFSLGTFATAIMLLTHRERLQHHSDLMIDCAGDEYALHFGNLSEVPGFSFSKHGRLQLVHRSVGYVGNNGSPTAFFPNNT